VYYEEVFRALNQGEIRYLVVGGVAAVLHGVPRVTADLDVMVELSSTNLNKLVKVLEQLGYVPGTPVPLCDLTDAQKRRRWREEKHATVFTVLHPDRPYESVDILLENPIAFEEVEARKEVLVAGSLAIPLVCLEDLIDLKRRTGRDQDRLDAMSLEKVQKLERRQR
jgi:predicted nucleotidyltransferase